MRWRHLLLLTGLAVAGLRLLKPRPAGPALPRADGAIPASAADDAAALAAELPLQSLQAGMPADMHADADHARPGFADYARGA